MLTFLGGVTSFCFGQSGDLFLCSEQRLWHIQLAKRRTRQDEGDDGILLGPL
jgi:hypothetical protein